MNYYQKQYEELVYFRQHVEILTDKTKTELHHIKMRSLYPELINEKSNLVRLKTSEHILAHKYLKQWYTEEFGLNDVKTLAASLAYDMLMLTRYNANLSIEEATTMRESIRITISNISKELWKDPAFRNKQAIGLAIANSKPEVKKRRSEAATKNLNKLWNSDIYRANRTKRIAGTKRIFNIKTKTFKYLKPDEIQQYLDAGWTYGTPIYNIPVSGKYKGQLLVVYICPWKVNTCKRLKPRLPGRKPVWSLTKPDV